jgi:hypothetical protein
MSTFSPIYWGTFKDGHLVKFFAEENTNLLALLTLDHVQKMFHYYISYDLLVFMGIL